jgi:PKD repeat protein
MAGGAGAQWYLAGHDASLTNYETDLGGHFDRLFRMTGITRVFVQENMPFYDAFPRQDLINTGYCLAVEEEAYLIYLPNGGTADLNLSGNSKGYTLQWFDPRNGGQLQNGNVTSLTGGAVRNIGTPPSSHNEDWACLIKVASVTAGLSASKTAICGSEELIFTSNSIGMIDDYIWDFGAGASPATATTAGPHIVSYSTPGEKTVSLIVSGPDGSDTREINDFVSVYDNCGELTRIDITPATKNVVIGTSQTFVAAGSDPVGSDVAITPTWLVDGGGTISESGEFTATTLGGPFMVSATSGGVIGSAIINVVEPVEVLLNDSFTRGDAATLGVPETGNTWQEVESGANTAEIAGNQTYFTSADALNTPLVKSLFAEQNSGTVHWSFDINWSRTGGEGTYELYMQLGHGLINTDKETGVAVDLKWGGPNNGMTDHEGFGYVSRDGTVNQLQVVSGTTRIDIYADMLSRHYDIYIAGTRLASEIPFRKGDAVIKEARFFSNGVNTANFGGRGFDNVYLANRSDANDGNETGSFAQYIANYPALVNEDANPEADPDGDGISNQLEQWFASDPTVPNTGNAPVQGSTNGQTFHFEFTFDATVSSTRLIYETSPDLENWTPHTLDPSWITLDGDLRRVRTSAISCKLMQPVNFEVALNCILGFFNNSFCSTSTPTHR